MNMCHGESNLSGVVLQGTAAIFVLGDVAEFHLPPKRVLNIETARLVVVSTARAVSGTTIRPVCLFLGPGAKRDQRGNQWQFPPSTTKKG